uniref:Cytochrome P450 CYP3 n=1 Tax=Dermanyssus gallinae TaxID=34641 RepID=A0A6M3HAK0_9ACAR|nr:cytochrome P450 CYP3 [Dermanyssus gallinae]
MWAVLVLILAIIVIKYLRLRFYWQRHGIPYEPYERYLYRVLWLFRTRVMHAVLTEDAKKYGKLYGSYRGLTPTLVVTDVELAKDVLITQFGHFFERSIDFRTGDPLWDNSLSHLPYEQWKLVRTVMGYCMTSSKMRSMIPKLDNVAKRLVAKLEHIAKGDENQLDLKKYLSAYGLDSMVAIAFGIDLDCIEKPDNDFIKYGSNIFKPGFGLLMMILCPALLKYCPFADFPPKATSEFFGALGKRILAEKRERLDEVIKNNTPDIMDLHLIAQREDPNNKITDEMLASQAFLFFIAGLDTTVNTLQLCTYFLAVNPEAQQRVYDEIRQVMDGRSDVQYQDVQKMKLLEASLLESTRLVPIIPLVDRICTRDTTVAGVPFKKGMMVEIPLPPMHRNPDYFPEPEKFIPERFLKDGEISSETAAFLMFGDGPKSCVGRRLALMNMQVLLANVLLTLRLDSCPQTPPFQLKKGLHVMDMLSQPPIIQLILREKASYVS